MKAVLFDLGHTLIAFDEKKDDEALEECAAIISRRKPVSKKWLWQHRGKYFHELSTGAIDENEFWTLALRELGINDANLPRLLAEAHATEAKLYEDALPAIRLLRKAGFKIGILANSRVENEVQYEKLLKKHVGKAIFSHKLGFRKPHKNAYLALCRALKTKPKDCVFVSDEIYEDLWGAKRLGMKTAFIKRKRSKRGFSVDPDWEAIKPDFQANSLVKLAEQIIKKGLPHD